MNAGLAEALSPPVASPGPRPRAVIKRLAEDFQVWEELDHALDGRGQHLWLEVRKTGLNTEDVARRLAAAAAVRPRDVGFAGLKDRNAVARQWFSVPWQGDEAAFAEAVRDDGVALVSLRRHGRKLRRGALAGNRFRILAREVEADAATLSRAAARIAAAGVPNYFGAQRFGRGGDNVERARAMLATTHPGPRRRHLRGLYLSAARAFLFNRVLAQRVRTGSWSELLQGEAVMLAGSSSFFVADVIDAPLRQRLARFDLHPSGPLWGLGGSAARGQARALEAAALADCEALASGLEAQGMTAARRPLRVAVRGLRLERAADAGGWWLEFRLPAGAYATVVLAELFCVDDASARRAAVARGPSTVDGPRRPAFRSGALGRCVSD